MDLVVVLCIRESLRHEGDWLVHAICLCLGEYCSGHKVGGVTFEVEVTRLGREGEDGGRGVSWYDLPSFLSHLCLCPTPSPSPSDSIQPHPPAFHCLHSNSEVYSCNYAMSALGLALD